MVRLKTISIDIVDYIGLLSIINGYDSKDIEDINKAMVKSW